MASTSTSTLAAAAATAADAVTAIHRAEFDRRYDTHLRHLRLKGLRPKTIEAYSRGVRRMGEYFDYRIDALSSDQLSRYFSDLLQTHSWSSVKLDLYGYKYPAPIDGGGQAAPTKESRPACLRVASGAIPRTRRARQAARPGWPSRPTSSTASTAGAAPP